MVMLCQQCGDKGFSNAFVYCVECLGFAIHRYCLDIMPKTFDELVHWVCEECEPRLPNHSTFSKHNSIQCQKKDYPSSAIHCRAKLKKKGVAACLVAVTEEDNCHGETAEPQRQCVRLTDSPLKIELTMKKLRKRRHIESSQSQQPNRAHAKHDSADHAQLAADRSLLKIKLRKRKMDATFSVTETEELRLQTRPHKACTEMDPTENSQCVFTRRRVKVKKKDVACSVDESNKRLDLNLHAKLVSNCSPMKMESDKKMKDNTCTVAETDKWMHAKQDINIDNVLVDGDCFPNNERRIIPFCSEDNIKDLKLEKEQRLVNECESGNEVSHHGLAQPVIDPIWRGSFNIIKDNCDTYEGLVGHVSNKACLKVCEEASLLPSLLCLEMLPISVLWPKSFQESEPSDENIALYFFPADTKHERVFDNLVDDMKAKELAMRARVKNAELLIFTSTELPLSYWRFQGKYYLWGVFKGKKSDSSPPPVYHQLTVSNRRGKCVLYTNSPNDMVTGQRTLTSMKTWDAQSPLSPLTHMGELGMDVDPETVD